MKKNEMLRQKGCKDFYDVYPVEESGTHIDN